MLLWATITAWAGSLDVRVAVDSLVATSRNDEPGSGPETTLASADIGLRARVDLTELDGRFKTHVDFRGRMPVAGRFKNSAMPLLYRAEVRYGAANKRLWLGLGRFLAPTTTFLPVDGVNATWLGDGWQAGAFAGRRGITTGRKNVAIDDLLPAAGGFFGVHQKLWSADVVLAYTTDRVIVGTDEGPDDDDPAGRIGGLSGQLRAEARPVDILAFGGQVGMHQQAAYLLGPTWTEATIEVQALELFNALGWASVRPTDWFRADVDALHQGVQVWAAGTIEGTQRVEDLQEPRFTDFRLRLRAGPPKIGWLRPMLRYRIRPDRTELRAGARLDINELGVPGLFVTGQLYFDDIRGENQAQDVGPLDRTFGSGAIGIRHEGLDARLGASYVDRGANPVSGRRLDPANPGQPTSSDDLQPFTLEADPLLFARVFYTGKTWFAGADLEKHLTEGEFRVLLQVGHVGKVAW